MNVISGIINNYIAQDISYSSVMCHSEAYISIWMKVSGKTEHKTNKESINLIPVCWNT